MGAVGGEGEGGGDGEGGGRTRGINTCVLSGLIRGCSWVS